ncbi:carbohydrate porin [Planctomycetota bacterium]|nr:carbohydrate porin [Planctomycetota bacterium]
MVEPKSSAIFIPAAALLVLAPALTAELAQTDNNPAASANFAIADQFQQWYQNEQDYLASKGIEAAASLTVDYSKNLMGGISTRRDALRSLFDLSITFDLETIAQIKNATFFIDAYSINGDDGSEVLTGDAQAFSNIDYSDNRTQIAEAWFEQTIGNFAYKLGKIDVNGDFAFVESAGEFINSSAGFSPTIIGFPTYPETAFGLTLKLLPSEESPYFASLGIYDGSNLRGIRTGLRGPSSFIDNDSDLFLITEAGIQWTVQDQLAGRFAIGVWRYTGDIEYLSKIGHDNNTTGYYGLIEQQLYNENDTENQGLNGFIQFGVADKNVAEIDRHVGAGLVYTGLLPNRDDDSIGLMGSYIRLSNPAGVLEDTEFAAELFYKAQLTQNFSIKPDIQWIANPGGIDGNDALVSTLRAEISF